MNAYLNALLGGGTVIVTSSVIALLCQKYIIAFFTRRIEHDFNKKLAEHEAKLKSETDAQVAAITSELKKNEFRHSLVFQTTEKTIANAYRLLLEVKKSAYDLTGAFDTDSQNKKLDLHTQKVSEFYNFYYPNKIYIPVETAKLIDAFSEAASHATFTWVVQTFPSSLPVKDLEKRKELYSKFFSPNGTIQTAINTLELDFQNLLGFPKPENKSVAIEKEIK